MNNGLGPVMAQVNIIVAGRPYALTCRDGEEERLQYLAAHLNRKAEELTRSLGQLAEPRLLLMTALLITDEYFDLQQAPPPASLDIAAVADLFDQATSRVDSLTAKLVAPMPS